MRARDLRQPVRRLPLAWWSAGVLATLGVVVAACTNLDDLSEPDCAYAVSPTTVDVDNQGGSGTLTIRAPGVCAWTVENPADWVTITGARSGEGNGSVGYAVATHEGFDYRYATLTVAGQGVSVSQQGRDLPPVCTYSVAPVAIAAPAAGVAGTIAVAAPAGCAWSVATQVNWVAITSGANGSGSGAFGYAVAANASGVARSGSLSAGGQTIGVTQAASGPPPPPPPPPNCSYNLKPNSASFSALGGVRSITVSTTAGCPWTAVSQQGWIVILSGGSGTGTGTVQYSVAVNLSGDDRDGRIVVAGRNFNISQDEDDTTPSGVLPSGR